MTSCIVKGRSCISGWCLGTMHCLHFPYSVYKIHKILLQKHWSHPFLTGPEYVLKLNRVAYSVVSAAIVFVFPLAAIACFDVM